MTDDLHELSALYALDALPGDDRERFEEHLAGCERCAAELREFRETVGSLAFAVEGVPPPDELRARVLAAARAEGQNVVSLRARRSAGISIAAALAVAATAAAVAVGVWAASLHHSLAQERAANRVLGDPTARHVALQGAPGQLVVDRAGHAVLSVQLPPAPSGKAYEAWVADPQVRRAGLLSGRSTRLDVRVHPGARVMVSVERAGGVDAPTTKPIVVAQT
jgi:anti-sigma factor RsiW